VLLTCLSVLNTILIAVFIVFLYKFKASIPDLLQGALNDVGEQLSGIFKEPQVKRAMSVLGKESGKVRASDALKNKVAEKAIGSSVLLKKGCEYFGITPVEAIELMQDPTFGPIIQGFVVKGSQAIAGLGGGHNNPGGYMSPSSNRGNVPNMS